MRSTVSLISLSILALSLTACMHNRSDDSFLALARTGIGLGPLAAHGKAAAMPQTAPAGDILEPRDVLGDLAPQITLDRVVLFDVGGDAADLFIRQVLGAHRFVDPHGLEDVARTLVADPKDVGQRDHDTLVVGDVHPGDTRHAIDLSRP